MPTERSTTVRIALEADDRDEDERWQTTDSLRSTLLDLDDVNVAGVRDDTPPAGAKGVADVAGWLVVNLGASGLSSLLSAVQAWAARSRCDVELSIDGDSLRISGASAETQERIVDAWLSRHPGGA